MGVFKYIIGQSAQPSQKPKTVEEMFGPAVRQKAAEAKADGDALPVLDRMPAGMRRALTPAQRKQLREGTPEALAALKAEEAYVKAAHAKHATGDEAEAVKRLQKQLDEQKHQADVDKARQEGRDEGRKEAIDEFKQTAGLLNEVGGRVYELPDDGSTLFRETGRGRGRIGRA